MVKGIAEDLLHRLLSHDGVAPLDGGRNGSVILQVSTECIDGNIEHGREDRFNGPAEAAENWIVCGL